MSIQQWRAFQGLKKRNGLQVQALRFFVSINVCEIGPQAEKTNMRLRSLILCLLLCVIAASAKDVITKTDGTQIDAKVEEVTETVIKYRKLSNPTGPIYSIPIASVATIRYENGAVDSFGELTATSSSTLSDDELMRFAEGQTLGSTAGNVSDNELLKLYGADELTLKDIKKYRKIGWIGGGSIFAAGVVAGLILWGYWSWDGCDMAVPLGIMGGSLAAGAIWCAAFNIKATSMQRQASMLSGYSVPVMEKSFKIGERSSLTAGINCMGNHYTRNHGMGLSLGINF